MRTALATLTEELRRLQAAGVKRISVSDQALGALRAAIASSPSSRPPEAARPATSAAGPEAAKPEPKAPAATAAFPPTPPIVLPAGDKAARWEALKALVLNDPVCRARVRPGKKVVLGVGDVNARIFFVGEAPGAEEEVQGEPFVGPAGQLLNRMIAAMGLDRGQVYIGNIMNWRPELPLGPGGVQVGNRPPTAEELAYCLPYLKAQLDIVDPALIVALGATAAHGLLGPGVFKALGEVRGRWRDYGGKPLMITYHPSYILRNPTNRSKRMIWEDLLQVMERAQMTVSDKQRGYFLDK